MRQNFGDISDFEIIDRLLAVGGLKVIDVGCGAGDTTRKLAEKGAEVLGVEPDSVQAAKNRAAPPADGLTFAEAGAENLPAESDSVDGVFFFRSLHHVPADRMDDALREAARVLKPDGGFLFVVEPSKEGSYFPLTCLFNDETEVRTLAQEALERTASAMFDSLETYRFERRRRYESFEDFVERFAGKSYLDVSRELVERPDVMALFEAGRTDDGYWFDQPMLLNLYRGSRA